MQNYLSGVDATAAINSQGIRNRSHPMRNSRGGDQSNGNQDDNRGKKSQPVGKLIKKQDMNLRFTPDLSSQPKFGGKKTPLSTSHQI